MKIIPQSHVDHHLTPAHIAFILERYADCAAFFIETIEMPDDLPGLPCTLHGPIMGDDPVPDEECEMLVRGERAGPSRICAREPRLVHTLTVIGGPDGDEPCVLYTAYGGAQAPREPWDPSLTPEAREEAIHFWAEHALSP
jgi:hypothetical protein